MKEIIKQEMKVDDIVNLIDSYLKDYKELQLKAMEDNDEKKVYQFTGSMVALSNLRGQLVEEEYEETDDEYEENCYYDSYLD